MNIKDSYNPTINFIDLLSYNAAQIINEIYKNTFLLSKCN